MVDYGVILQNEIRPALGCTEPIAAALAVAHACSVLPCRPERISLLVSRNILKNAMHVGVPGTGMAGIEIACALSAIAGNAGYGLEVLHDITPEDVDQARVFVKNVTVALAGTPKTLYIRAEVFGGGHCAVCTLEDHHTGITQLSLDGKDRWTARSAACDASAGASGSENASAPMTVEGIYQFALTAPVSSFAVLKEAVDMNRAVAQEGLANPYGLQIGRRLMQTTAQDSLETIAAFAAAAADARMGGCMLPVMTTAGSGNQGLTATLPCIAAATLLRRDEEALLRALAISCLVTVHIKSQIGKLSALCGCAIAASIGTACGLTYLMGGGIREAVFAIQNMIADISGLICDGAKAGCALKLATGVSAALQCARLAMTGAEASAQDGIVAGDVEQTIRNLGLLGTRGMAVTDQVILDMMLDKA